MKQLEPVQVLERSAFGSVDWAWIWNIYIDFSRPRSLTVIARQSYPRSDKLEKPRRFKCGRDPDELVTAIQDEVAGFDAFSEDLESGEIQDIADKIRPFDPTLADGVQAIAERWDIQ